MKKSSDNLTIDVASSIARILGSRDTVAILKALSVNAKKVKLDFKDVQFISRSAAHELLLLQEDLRQRDIDLVFSNTNEEITKMLRVVAANRAVPTHRPKFEAERMSFKTLLQETGV